MLWGEDWVRVEGGGDVEAGGVVTFDAGNAGLEDVACLPELGALVHVLVQPLVPERQVELLDEERELRVERSEERERPLQELD